MNTMSDERELERHNKVLDAIKLANTREDLPKIGFSNIASYLANNVYFNNEKLSQKVFQPVINAIIDHGFVTHPEVKNALIRVILENYPFVLEEEIVEMYTKILGSKRIGYILAEITQRNLKLDEIIKRENKFIHEQIIKDINACYEIKYLPKVGLSELNKKLLRAVNDNDFVTNIKTSDIKELTVAFLEHYSYLEIEDIIYRIVSKYDLSETEKELMKEQILGSLLLDETIEYTVEEINLKEKRKLQIYKMDHEETMDAIKEAHRISQLPPNLTVSVLNNYLNGNTTIYPNDDRITAEDLKSLTDLLMEGHKWEEDIVIFELKKIALAKYPEKEDAFQLLYNKLVSLPRTYYLVEEIKYSQERQVEFIGRRSSNVNVYFIPNSKSPIDGGRFYNCYVNRVDNLDLSTMIPLNIEEKVPEGMDIDSIENYIQEHYDPTFKAAGGIILNRDETIGNVSVFSPYQDGTVGISIEKSKKIDEVEDLDRQIEEKKKELDELTVNIEEAKKHALSVESQVRELVENYERKVISLQNELMENILELKTGIGLNDKDSRKGL